MSLPLEDEYQQLCNEYDEFSAIRIKQAQDEGKAVLYRVGSGVDVHSYTDEDKPCMIGCTTWLESRAVGGHSDGDLVAHAICDGILSACRLGDLGLVFGVDDPVMKNASGTMMLEKVVDLVTSHGWFVENVSVQLVANTPKMMPFQYGVGYGLSKILKAPVSFSATTSDGLGFSGRGDGLVAIATVQVSKIV